MKSFFKTLAIVLYPLPLVAICAFFLGRMVWSNSWHIGWLIHPDILLAFTVSCFFILRFVFKKYNRELCKKPWVRGYLFTIDGLATVAFLVLCITCNWKTFAGFCTMVLPTLSFAILNLGLRLFFHWKDRGQSRGSAWLQNREQQRERFMSRNQERL